MEEENTYELVEGAKNITSLDRNPCYGVSSKVSTAVKSRQVKSELKKPTYSWVCYTFALVGIILVGSAAFASLAISIRNSSSSISNLERSLAQFQNDLQANYSRSLMQLQNLVDELQTNNSRSLMQLQNLVDHNFELQTNNSRSLDSKINTLHMIGQDPSNPVASCCHVLLLNLSSPSGHYWIRSSNGSAVRGYCDFDGHYADNCNGLMPSNLGLTEDNPASSCKALPPWNPSGYYWISTQGSPVRVYCNMNATSVNLTRGWMRVAYIDMRNTSQQCPSELTLLSRSSAPRRACDIIIHSGCVNNTFSVHGVEYSHVYGRIIAYQNNVPIAFYFPSLNTYNDIDSQYVYGVSLTHGQSPRNHIWTFAGASDETSTNPTFKCPCINTSITPPPSVPDFIGNDYFCDTALSTHYPNVPTAFQPANPLWDGEGCGPTNTCCSFNHPPWFIKHLPSPTTDDIEMRMCRSDTAGSTPIEIVELYIQ